MENGSRAFEALDNIFESGDKHVGGVAKPCVPHVFPRQVFEPASLISKGCEVRIVEGHEGAIGENTQVYFYPRSTGGKASFYRGKGIGDLLAIDVAGMAGDRADVAAPIELQKGAISCRKCTHAA